MRLSASLLKFAAPAVAALLLLTSAPGCGSNSVVVGRSVEKAQLPAEKAPVKAEEKAAPKPAAPEPSKTIEPANTPEPAQELETAKAEAAAAPEAKPSSGGMMSFPKASGEKVSSAPVADAPKPAEEKTAAAEPMNSPARPLPPKEERTGPKMSAPYKLDLSFGGFGLGVGLLDTPVGVAVDSQENIYVVDQGNYRIQKFDRFGIFQFAWGRQGVGDGEFTEQKVNGISTLRETGDFEFNKPIGILLDTDDFRNLIRITVVDSLNHRIQRFLLTQNQGDQFPDFGPANVFIMLPKGEPNAPDPDLQNKYVSERRQVILDPVYISLSNGAFPKANNFLLAPFIWGKLGYSQGLLNAPTYLTKDDSGILYVSDTENARVQGFYVTPANVDTDCTFFREWGNAINLPYGAGRLNQPTALEFDNSGFGGFLVLDKLPDGTYNIQRFDREGQFLGVFASSGDKEGQLRQPVALAVNPFDNTVYVTDRGRKKVMVYNSKGEFLYEFGGEELADPRGIAVLRNSYVYVTDAEKNMVYRYVPQ